ncbi:MAG: hypothetical protein HY550_10390 [Elusimicrobia bacterium]|nr:hypothetical protein [Elusimicrobiota bacterium]
MSNKELEELRGRWRQVQDRHLSEIDTQVLLVEPILKISGWDLLNYDQIHRASRNPRAQEFDIEIYSSSNLPRHLTFAIECKALKSAWFNINKLSTGIGQLKKEGKDSTWVHNYNRCDGVGQLRAYCANWPMHFSKEHSTAIFTDGYDWVIFDNRTFVLDAGLLNDHISEKAVKTHANLMESEFTEKIIKCLAP